MGVTIPEELKKQIKQAMPLTKLMTEMYQKQIVNNKTICDFHTDSKPSMHLFPDGGYKCFVCDAGKYGQELIMPDGEVWEDKGNDVVGWLANKERLTIPEAYQLLSSYTGIDLPQERYDPEADKLKNAVTEQNRKFYHELLADQDAMDYLYKRGIDTEEIAKWRMGMVPWSWHDQRFAGRIVFGMTEVTWNPAKARTIAMAYRAREERDYLKHGINVNDEKKRGYIMGGKYLNDPNGLIYEKKNHLYGLTEATPGIRKEKCAVIMEGYTDVIMAHKSGMTNAVAVCGVAITEQQVELLSKHTKRVFLWLDGDAAGIAAMKRSLPMLLRAGFEVLIIDSNGKDPADLVGDGVDLRLFLKQNYKQAAQMMIDSALEDYDKLVNAARTKAMEDLIPLIDSIARPAHKANFKAVVENRLGVHLPLS